MISAAGEFFQRIAKRVVPDPFTFALLLTLATLLLGCLLTPASPLSMVGHWARGFWELLEFAMQMSLILVTGHALAYSPPLRSLVRSIARLPRSAPAGAAIVAFTSCAAAMVNWGLGLVIGSLMALEVSRQATRRGLRMHYPLLGAAGYTGLLVWHGGMSGSAPLAVATSGHFLEAKMGVIPIGETLGSPLNLITGAVLLVLIPTLCYFLSPRRPEAMEPIQSDLLAGEPPRLARAGTLAGRLDRAVLLSLTVGGMGVGYCLYILGLGIIREGNLLLSLNLVNLLFLSLGILLHGRPILYAQAINRAIGSMAGILLQFPFYAGIMGMMRYSGLIDILANGFVRISTPFTFPAMAFFGAGLVNLFVPSGGGQWAVQGPILIEAAQRLGVSAPKTVMALSYGDQWTNMIQPFWALALLGITGLKASDLLGYTTLIMIVTGAVFVAALLFLPA